MISNFDGSASQRPCVLVACSDFGLATELCARVGALGCDTVHASDSADALSRIAGSAVKTVLCARQFASRDGIDFLAEVREQFPTLRRVLVTEVGDVRSAAEAVNRAGVHYWAEVPCDSSVLEQALGLEAAAPSPPRVSATPSRRGDRLGHIIGESPAMVQLLEIVERVAGTTSTVLVTGETGTGKELIGQAIHDLSPRSVQPFAAVNSAAIPETLLESELFGHRRGSFTGATSDSTGLFEGADGGTVFLDEVGEMPLPMQAKLLRFLQTGEVRPVGARQAQRVDVRLVAATNRRLEDEVACGAFREDLYYRLAVIPIHVPPLRERLEDIPLLVDDFMRRLGGRYGRPGLELEDSALDLLVGHDWPGNVRELENVIERGVALAKQDCIGADELPLFERRRIVAPASSAPESLPSIERRHIIDTLEHVGWNRKRAAQILQISTTTLWRRLKEFGIEPQASRPIASID